MSKPHLLITGASGYLGTHLLSALTKNNNYELTGLDIRNNSELPKSIHFVKADLSDVNLLSNTLNNVDLICHCASLLDSESITNDQYKVTNIKGTENLYQQAKEKGVKKIVLTSSIAAISMKLWKEDWPINEDFVSKPDDDYGLSKNTQEVIARNFSNNNDIQTLTLRPCTFFFLNDPERGFRLTGVHAMVEDIVNAHIAAIKVLLDEKKASKLNGFEVIFVTNKLPYQNADKKLVGSDGKMRKLISKYWPDNAKFVFDLGYKKTFFPCVYDLSKAKRILNWEPSFNFDQWLIYCKKQNLDFQDIKKEYQLKRSWNFRLQKLFFKVKKKLKIK